MRSRITVAVILFFVAFNAACDQRAPTDPARAMGPRAAILDGSSGGNAHFFFLPPIVKNPSFSGVFNPNVAPTVEICTNTQQTASGNCASLLARFRRHPAAGDAPEPITVSGQQYLLNWNTKEFAVPLETPFRVVVMVGSIQLGHIDLVRATANSYRNFTTGDVINRTTKGTIPIAFRIENGALCATTSVECFEGSVGPAGGTFTITRADGTKPAGTEFPAGALNETVTLIIERWMGECLPTDAPQYQGCYRFRTEPHLENFELPVTVGVCMFDYSALSYFDSGQLRLWKWSEVAGEAITELERVTVQYLECPPVNPPTVGFRSSPLLLGAARTGSLLLKPLAALLLPREAHALIPYEGGKLINFSRIGWVRPLSVEITGGNDQTGMAGHPLANPLTARVVNRYGALTEGVPARAVTFTPSGNGSAAPSATFSDGTGGVSTVWTLSTSAGPNTLLARALTSRPIAPSPYEAEALFTANGTPAYSLFWLPTLGTTFDYTGVPATGLQPTVDVTNLGTGGGITLNTIETTDGYQAAWDLTQLADGATYRLMVRLGGVVLGYMDLTVRDGTLRTVVGDRQVLVLADVSLFRFKFKLLQ